MQAPRPTYANVVSTLSLVLALGGVAWAAGLPANSVGSRQLKRNSVTLSKIAPGSVTTTRLAKASVTDSKLAPGAVRSVAIAPGSVGSDAIGPDAVSATRLAPNAVEPRNISPATIAALLPIAASVHQTTIQQVGPTQVTIGQVTVTQPGRYFLSFVIRAFPRAANEGHNLNCSLGGTDVSGGPSINNAFVATTTGVQMLPTQSVATVTTAPATLSLSCRQIIGTGEVTVTFDLSAIKVLDPPA